MSPERLFHGLSLPSIALGPRGTGGTPEFSGLEISIILAGLSPEPTWLIYAKYLQDGAARISLHRWSCHRLWRNENYELDQRHARKTAFVHIALEDYLNDTIPGQRNRAMRLGISHVAFCRFWEDRYRFVHDQLRGLEDRAIRHIRNQLTEERTSLLGEQP